MTAKSVLTKSTEANKYWSLYKKSVAFLEAYRSGRLLSQHNDILTILYEATKAIDHMQDFMAEFEAQGTLQSDDLMKDRETLTKNSAEFEYQLGEYRAFLEVLVAAREDILRKASEMGEL